MKALIVNDGEWRSMSVEKGSYDTYCDTIKALLERIQVPVFEGGRITRSEPVSVEIIKLKELDAKLTAGDIGLVVFVTRGLAAEADKIKHDHKNVRVLLLTGDPIETAQVIIVRKEWVSSTFLERFITS